MFRNPLTLASADGIRAWSQASTVEGQTTGPGAVPNFLGHFWGQNPRSQEIQRSQHFDFQRDEFDQPGPGQSFTFGHRSEGGIF